MVVRTAGVVGLQGAVSEHIETLNRAFAEAGERGEAIWVRRLSDLERVDALVLPGGESTTISKLLVTFDLFERVVGRAEEGMPILGTCAGMIVMCQRGDDEVERTDTRLLGLLSAQVDRNAFGRQRESFEADVDVEGLDSPFHAVFIRAPAVVRTWDDCTPIATLGDKTVMVRQGSLLAASFHPELTDDLRIHRMLLDML
ncbi:MAG: pyridoxal 5'-phosphate synthase glutaminase subunit PdxT [Thermoplasmata archaeon]|nr:MAG: pyridoxal 5'-phosphate synthase glutaminase subunit PdxT [Thermoplasmata archaeon]